MREAGCPWLAPMVAGSPVRAKFAAPIQTNAAIAFEPGNGSVKLDGESGIGRQEAHRASQTLPEGALQNETTAQRLLGSSRALSTSSPSNAVAGIRGHWRRAPCGGARYLLSGGAERLYAISPR